jgi:hypothetical protein
VGARRNGTLDGGVRFVRHDFPEQFIVPAVPADVLQVGDPGHPFHVDRIEHLEALFGFNEPCAGDKKSDHDEATTRFMSTLLQSAPIEVSLSFERM